MRYLLFDNEATAQAYADAQTAMLPTHGDDATVLWDVPRPTADGRWIVASANDEGEPWQEAFAAPVADGA